MVEACVQDVRDKEWRMTNLDMVLKAGEVGHWTALTLVYRAIPNAHINTTVNAECIEAARTAFRCHEECMNLTSISLFAKVGYLHWYSFLSFALYYKTLTDNTTTGQSYSPHLLPSSYFFVM